MELKTETVTALADEMAAAYWPHAHHAHEKQLIDPELLFRGYVALRALALVQEQRNRAVALLAEFAFEPSPEIWVPAAELLAQFGVWAEADSPERAVGDSALVRELVAQWNARCEAKRARFKA